MPGITKASGFPLIFNTLNAYTDISIYDIKGIQIFNLKVLRWFDGALQVTTVSACINKILLAGMEEYEK